MLSTKKNLLLFLHILFILSSLSAQTDKNHKKPVSHPISLADTGLIARILRSGGEQFQHILNDPKQYEVQIIYTQIDRDSNNIPSFKQYTYGPIGKGFFYPASLVKLPCSALALQKINSLKIAGLTANSIMITDSVHECQKKIAIDTTASDLKPSLTQYIKRMLLISDNESYNRVYEFLGQPYIAEQLTEKGYADARVLNRFDSDCDFETNRFTNPVSFFDSTDKLLYTQAPQENKQNYVPPLGKIMKGKAHLDKKDHFVKGPWDFSNSNYLPLADVTDMLKSIVFPGSVNQKKSFEITAEQRLFLLKYMSMYPRESTFPNYKGKDHWDSFKKYLIYGGMNKSGINQDTLRIFNVVGQSYGYISDCAYVADFKNNIEFMLSAVIYVNKDDIINDGKYDYKEIGFPFLQNLGRAIYQYDKSRKRDHPCDLNEFRLSYK